MTNNKNIKVGVVKSTPILQQKLNEMIEDVDYDVIDESVDAEEVFNDLYDKAVAYCDKMDVEDFEAELAISEMDSIKCEEFEIPFFRIYVNDEGSIEDAEAVNESEDFEIDEDNDDWIVYLIEDKIYWMATEEFNEIASVDVVSEDAVDEKVYEIDDETLIEELKSVTDSEGNIQCVSVDDEDTCKFLIGSLISTITGEIADLDEAEESDEIDYDYEDEDLPEYQGALSMPRGDDYFDESEDIDEDDDMFESIKLRKFTIDEKITTDGDDGKSKKIDEIENGTKEEIDFDKAVDKASADAAEKAKEDQEEPLTQDANQNQQNQEQQPQQENYHPHLPNFHRKSVNEAEMLTQVFEPGEKVIWKTKNLPAQISIIQGNIITIICQGMTIDVTSNQLQHIVTGVQAVKQFDFDKNDLTTSLDDPFRAAKHKDLNKKCVACDLYAGTYKINETKCYANLKDLMFGKKNVRILAEAEDGIHTETFTYPADQIVVDDVPSEDWVYAVVIAGDEEEPTRRIKVNPTSYVEADEDENVECLVADKLSSLPKKIIRILS